MADENSDIRTSTRSTKGIPPERYGISPNEIEQPPVIAGSSQTVVSDRSKVIDDTASMSSKMSSKSKSSSSRRSVKTVVSIKNITTSLTKLQEIDEESYKAYEKKEEKIAQLRQQIVKAIGNNTPPGEVNELKVQLVSLEKLQEREQQMFLSKRNSEKQKIEFETASIKDDESIASSRSKVDEWMSKNESQRQQSGGPGDDEVLEHDLPQQIPQPTNYQLPPKPQVQAFAADPFHTRLLPAAQIQPCSTLTRDDLLLAFREITLKSQKPPNLPEFDGNDIMQFPSFLSELERTTAQYEIKPADNLRRINFALKGNARSAVQHLLTNPTNIERIVQILKNNYGRTDWVLLTLKDKMRHLTPIKEDDLESFKRFFNDVTGIVGTLKNLGNEHYLHDPEMIVTLANKLPSLSKSLWCRYKAERDSLNKEVSLETFSVWLEGELSAQFATYEPHTKKSGSRTQKPILFQSSTPSACLLCKTDAIHPLYKCPAFNNMKIDDRRELVKKMSLCFNCLKKGHGSLKCKSENRCTKCKKLHHSMLHKDEFPVNHNVEVDEDDEQTSHSDQEPDNTEQDEIDEMSDESENLLMNWKPNNCVLRMTTVKVRGPKGIIKVDALFDEGSTASIIDESLVNELGVDGPVSPITYKWTNEIKRFEADSKLVNIEVGSINGSKFYQLRQVRTTKNIALPKQKLNVEDILQNYPYIDPVIVQRLKSANPKLLIGSNNAGLIVPLKTLQSKIDGLQATKCHLGWTLHGSIQPTNEAEAFSMMHVSVENDELSELVKAQFKLDNFGSLAEKPRMSIEDEKALTIMKNTIRKVGDRFEIGHLYRNENLAFPTIASKAVARRRLELMERKMDRNDSFAQQYCEKINDYVTKNYAKKLEGNELKEDDHTYYLPHFGVTNIHKPGKFRLVFDAKSKAGGYSLNDLLLRGPDFVPHLTAVLWRARTKPKAFTADIREMFHQVRIRPEDINSQRFLFRGRERNQEPDVYVMTSMIFGAVSSPSQAQFVKNENAKQLESKYPGVYRPIREQTYVDDYFDNADNNDEALTTINNVRAAHQEGGFELAKWVTNDPFLTEQIPIDLRAPKSTSPYGHRVLGIYWDPENDDFIYPLDFNRFPKEYLSGERTITKRFLLKFMMSIFDPLGALTPIVIKLKILFQDVWRENYDWDQPLPQTTQLRFNQWLNEVDECKPVRIPRQYFPGAEPYRKVELIIVCDSSDKAYCAVAFYRQKVNQTYRLAMVQSKARVAPLKPALTVPKLELQAMTLGSQLCQTIMQETDLMITKRYLWTDSEIALNWLRSNKKLTSYVAARVSKIQEVTKLEEWRWVSGKTNIADWGTKPIQNIKLSMESEWFSGMEFLTMPEDQWPDSDIPELQIEEKIMLYQQELVVEEINLIHDTRTETNGCLIGEQINVDRFSNFNRLIRTTARLLSIKEYLIRIVRSSDNNKHNGKNSQLPTCEISLRNIHEALKLWIKQAQHDEYEQDIQTIQASGFVKKSSALFNLSPGLDAGILRLKGREPNYRPIILPPKHPFTKLLVEYYHQAFGHQGTNTILSSLRIKYWIPKIRALIKRIGRDCTKCKIQKAKPPNPEMGFLPPERLVTGVYPFTYCGVDYFGPVSVTIGRRVEKRWGALFTCLTIRAIHVELVHSLSTSSMIMALNRFCALRGTPKKMFSDNGTNFKGANNELKMFIKQLQEDKIEDKLSIRDIEWQFIPPGAPHWGGCWERDVRSVKTALTAILKDQHPSDEVLATAFCEAANIVNNRPLTNLSDDPNDLPPITPNDIILMRRNDNMFEVDFNPKEIDCRILWRKAQWIADQFWQRWVKEYRPTLVKRSKWFDNRSYYELKPGDLVVIIDETLKRGQWPKGIIEEAFKGPDGLVRVVTVRTNNTIYKRPVTKVALIAPAPENVVKN